MQPTRRFSRTSSPQSTARSDQDRKLPGRPIPRWCPYWAAAAPRPRIFGGFVEISAGTSADGNDAVAQPLLGESAWDVRLCVAITASGEEAIGSTAAMSETARSSPYCPAWLASVPGDLDEARAAIAARDLARLGAVAERSALRMHACAMAAEPHILCWISGTLAALATVKKPREVGVAAYATIDAGPHVKALYASSDAAQVEAALAATPSVMRVLRLAPGPGAQVTREGLW
jgi:diphosphomevalonate decarboxylase